MENPEGHQKITPVGKALVLIHQQEQNKIISEFIQANLFTHITQLTNTKAKTIKQCPEHIPRKEQWTY